MKTRIKISLTLIFLISALIFVPKIQFAQNVQGNVLDQNISIYADNESLSSIIERICNY